MSTAEFVEKYLGIKLLNCQKKYLDFLDEHPKAEIIVPRGRSSLMDLNTLYGVIKAVIEQQEEENDDRNN